MYGRNESGRRTYGQVRVGVFLVLASAESFAQAAVTDTISIHSATDFNNRRVALVQHIWGVPAINTTDDVSSVAVNQPNSLDIPLPSGAASTITRYTCTVQW